MKPTIYKPQLDKDNLVGPAKKSGRIDLLTHQPKKNNNMSEGTKEVTNNYKTTHSRNNLRTNH